MSTALAEVNAIDTTGMSKAERFAMRGIGASDFPIICGVGYRGKTRLSLCLEKQQSVPEVLDEDQEERMWWGDKLEDDIAERISIKHGVTWKAHQLLVRHPEHEWMTCTLDGLTTCGQIWDYKSSSYFVGKDLRDNEDDTLPDGWIIQANAQMACCEKDQAHWGVFSAGELRLKTFVIQRDDALIESMIELGKEFIAHVRNGTTPTEFEANDAEVLKRHFNRVSADLLTLDDPELLTHARHFDNAKAAIKEMEEERDRHMAALRMAVGNSAGAYLGEGWTVKRKEINRKGYSVEPSSYIQFTVKNGDRS